MASIRHQAKLFEDKKKELRDLVIAFILELHKITEGYLPEGLGWKLGEKEIDGKKQISLSFFLEGKGYYTVIADPNKNQMYAVQYFFEALHGAEGQKLLDWFKEELNRTKENLFLANKTIIV